MEEWCCVFGRKECRLLWYILLPPAPGLHCCHRSCTTGHPLSSYSKLQFNKKRQKYQQDCNEVLIISISLYHHELTSKAMTVQHMKLLSSDQ